MLKTQIGQRVRIIAKPYSDLWKIGEEGIVQGIEHTGSPESAYLDISHPLRKKKLFIHNSSVELL